MENGLIEFKINKTEIKNFIKEIKKTDIKYKNDIILYLNNILKNNYISNFNNVEHLKNTIYLIIKYNNNLSFDNVINSFEELYKNNIPLNYSEKDIDNFYNLLKNYLTIINHQTLNIHEHLLTFTNDIYNTFENKSLAQSIITKLSNITLLKNPTIKQHELLKICVKIQNYIVKSRSYYVDEHQYYANILVFINELNNSQYINNESFIIENEVNKIINNKLNYDEKKLGIYEVNEENIKKALSNLELINKRIEDLNNRLNDIDENSLTIHEDIKTIKKDFFNDAKNLLEQFRERKTFKITRKQKKHSEIIVSKDKLVGVNAYSRDQKLFISTFAKEYEQIFDLEFLMSLTETEKMFLNELHLQNELPMLKEALKNYYFSEINTLENWEIYKKFNSLFHEEIGKITIKQMKNLLSGIDGKEYLIHYIKNILQINPDFKFYNVEDFVNTTWFNKKTLELFDISVIAFAGEETQKLLANFYLTNQLQKLKKILDANPYFVDHTTNLHFLMNNNNVFAEEEIANFTFYQQLTFAEFAIYNKLEKLKKILAIKPDFIANDLTRYQYISTFDYTNYQDGIYDNVTISANLDYKNSDRVKFKELILENNEEDLIHIYKSHKLASMYHLLYGMYSTKSIKPMEEEMNLFNLLKIEDKKKILSKFMLDEEAYEYLYNIHLRVIHSNYFRIMIKKANQNEQKRLSLTKKD